MPTQDFGLYPDGLTAGTQVSSTYEGRYITLYESEITHPNHGTGFPVKGDPVVFGTVAGNVGVGVIVAIDGVIGAPAVTDLCAIDTEGIWNLSVIANNDAGPSLVTGGDELYIHTGTCIISKISNQATQIPFGKAMGQVVAAGTAVIAVHAHFDPSMDNAKRTYMTVASGAYVYGKHHTSIFAGGESTGLEYFDQQVSGAQTDGIYGFGTWMELAGGGTPYVGLAGQLTVAHEIGIYDAGATLGGWIVMQQIQGILASNPQLLYIWRINIAAAGGAVDSLIQAANPASVGFVAGAGVASAKNGNIPLMTVGGVVHWVRTYAGAN